MIEQFFGKHSASKTVKSVSKVVGLLMTSLLILLSKRLEKDFRVNEKSKIG